MRKIAFVFALGALLALSVTPAAAQGRMDRNMDRSGTTHFAPGSSTTGSVPADSPKQYFLSAKEAFNSREWDTAAKNLRQGADILRNDAAKAHGDVADTLRGTAKDLDKLADRVQRGQLKSYADVNDKVGDAYRNLADYHYQIANESYGRFSKSGATASRNPEVGNALNAAANDLEDWAAVTGRTLNAGARTAVDETRDLAGKMMTGTGWATQKAGDSINRLGTAIRDFGRDIRERVRSNPLRRESLPPGSAPASPGNRY